MPIVDADVKSYHCRHCTCNIGNRITVSRVSDNFYALCEATRTIKSGLAHRVKFYRPRSNRIQRIVASLSCTRPRYKFGAALADQNIARLHRRTAKLLYS